MKLYFVRHGQTYLNKYSKMQGWSDSPLTPEGESVASATGSRLKNIPFSAVYTSDLGRTIQTAKLILEENDHLDTDMIQPMKEFRETFFGSFEADYGKNVYGKVAKCKGIAVDEVFSALSLEELSDIMSELDEYGDAENSKTFTKRLKEGMKKITQTSYEADSPEILVVTHGNTIRHLVKGISPQTNVFQEIGNSSVTTVEYKDGSYQLLGFNT